MISFPVTESTLSAFHLGQFLQEKYLLSPKTICKLLRTGMNHLYHVIDDDNKFVFRVYTFNWRTKSDVYEELRLLRHLKKNNLPVSYPIADHTGEFIQEINSPEGIRYGVLFSFAEGGKVAKFTAQASFNIGLTMGKMHRATENYDLDRVTYNAKTLLTDSFKRTQSFFTNVSDEITFVKCTTDYLVAEYEKVNVNEVRQGVLHLDIWFDNMHFNEANEPTIFDFDFCGNGWLCHDIAYFMLQLYNTNPDENEYKLKAESFLKGYQTATRITDEEKRIIPLISISVMLFYLGIQCDRYDTWSNIFLNEDHLKRFIASLKRWIGDNKFQMDEQVSGKGL
jgi:Ser/Thr protein kinase RdoA (MazF antagonist)